jgi:hypothetical protein
VDLACRLLMRMVEQAARAPGVDMTRLCYCPLRPKRSTDQQGVPCFDAECSVLRAYYRQSRLRGTPRERAWLQAQYHRLLRAKCTVLYRCKARLLLANVRANRGLAVKVFLPRAQHTCACDFTSLGPFHSGSLPWWTRCNGSTIRRQVPLQGVEQLALPCRPCLWLPLLCDVLSSAHVTLLPLAITALDLRSLSLLFWAALTTQRTMFWPPCSADSSSCVQAMYQQHGR